jgi:predicted MPP superfamily phosphohydrolase
MLSRRQFLKTALVGGVATGLGLATHDLRSDSYTSDFKLEDLSVEIPGLPSSFQDYRIGFITDIHISTWVPTHWFERALETVKQANVDILLLGGDYILVHEISVWDQLGFVRDPQFSGLTKKEAIPKIYQAFANIASAYNFPDGILAVVGNHDHWNRFSVFMDILKGFQQIKLLINQTHAITRGNHSLEVFGVDDYLTGIPSLPPARELANGQAKRVILSHNPDYIPAILNNQQADFSLALCGHTHGGQIVLPALGAVAAQVVDRRFVSGMQRVDERQIYTSRGLGVVGLPFRINCPPEVTVITLKRA